MAKKWTQQEIEHYWYMAYGEELFYTISADLDFMATLHFDRFKALELKQMIKDWEEEGETIFWLSEKYRKSQGIKSLI